MGRLEDKERQNMKTCPFCKGNIEIRKISHMHKWGEEFNGKKTTRLRSDQVKSLNS